MNPGTARIEGRPAHRPASPVQRREHWRQPLLMWALVLATAMLSFYVHVLNEHMLRRDEQRTAQRSQQSAEKFGVSHRTAQTVRVAQTAPR